MEGPVDGAQLMAVYGIDEKALMALQKLAPERQSECLQKLQEGINSGKVRNASAFLIGIVTGPDALGIDDRARAMLNELPKPMQVELLNKLRMAVDVQNPSAWLISAVIKAKKTVGLAGMGGMMGMMAGGQMLGMGGNGMLGAQMMFGKMGGPRMGGMMARASPYGSPPQTTGSVPSNPEALQQVMVIIDEKARTLLQQLPEEKQVELASFLQARIQGGTVMNPSGWMVKSCLAAGAKSESIPGGNPTAMGGNPMSMGGSPAGNTVPANPEALQQIMMIIDDKAKSLLQKLPYEKQVDLASCLQAKVNEGKVMNPSGWMVKSCIAAGAGNASAMGGNSMAMGGNMTGMSSMSGGMGVGQMGTPRSTTPLMPQAVPLVMMVLDEKAKELLQQLPYEKQVDLASFLQQKMGDGGIRNPSAWMAKSCIAAGAQSGGGSM
mmetsp:Transcript_18476/g.49454  ORF Transcript_18476/g.49454 Transcript_18476/m.49454 type:complete len:436 (-) Transcript_18476:294-1601(-)